MPASTATSTPAAHLELYLYVENNDSDSSRNTNSVCGVPEDLQEVLAAFRVVRREQREQLVADLVGVSVVPS